MAETAGPGPGGEPVGVVGLGTMGGQMARHLLAAGFQVTGRDVKPECVAK